MALIMEEKPTPSGDAAGAARPRRARLPTALDERLRVVVAATTAAFLVVMGTLALFDGPLDAGRLGGVGLVALVACSVWGWSCRGRRPVVADGAEAAALLAAGLLLHDVHHLESAYLLALANATLRPRGPRLWFVAAAFGAGLVTVVLATGGGVGHLASVHLPRLALAVVLPTVIGNLSVVAERAARREEVLARAGRALAAADHDVDHIGTVAATAARDLASGAGAGGTVQADLLVGGGPFRRAGVGAADRLLPDTFELGVDHPGGLDAVRRAVGRDRVGAAHVHVVPLVARDVLRGAIVVVADEAPDAPLAAALDSLGVDTARALDAVAVTDGAAAREREVRRILDHSTDAIAVLDHNLVLTFECSGTRLLGWPTERLVGSNLGFLVHPDDLDPVAGAVDRAVREPGVPVTCEWRALHLDGHWVHLESVVTNLVHDDDVRGYLFNSRDVSERRRLEEHITHQSLHDPVTGLPNRTLFVDRVAHALERSRRRSRVPAVCLLDLDGFKQVNETYGHEVGDHLLRVVADRLRGTLREGDTAARFGGDEFAVLIEECDDAQVGVVVDRMHEALGLPVVVDGRTLLVRATVGVATPHPAWTGRELLQAADAALHVAKHEARGSWRRYDDTLPKPGERDGLLADLEKAVEADQLRLQYQPVVSLATGAITAVEALVRWHHPDRGTIPPNSFIPLAERSGLIIPIGLWVLRTATRQLRRWHDAFPDRPPLAVHVNVSAVQLADAAAVAAIGSIIERSGVDPGHITLEITESVLVADPVTANRQLARLKELGVRLAIDDFGVGYAGIGYLREFSVDQLKIDKSFVDNLATSGDTELFEAMLGFSQAFRLETVAEGVEDAEQAEILVRLGCTNAQGYHFARPLDPADLEGMLGRLSPPAAG